MEAFSLQPEKWVILYGDYLYSLAMMKTGSRETSQDLVQETFLSAVKAKDTFNGLSSEKTWLTAILRNKVIDFYRKKDVLKNASDYLADTEASFHAAFFDSAVDSYGHWRQDTAPRAWAESADAAMKRKEFYKILQYCIDKMPPRLIPAFVAKYIDEEDTEKICKELDLSSSNYWVMVHRAKVLMRSCLEKNWFLEER
ncbi:sigma-70 family RNA polymerase sigma factor [Fulvivirgaceae bacterium PWU4]|uniref:Sigma-70 family RNA polymerase sigma factor n=1 Tax=Chryseosolibacter histidini TaxID=2782349 RepID=A0AAP2DSW4_9BACT|nr:sigma-70 family RNA polymerase sigma factor [Chryseosolibacter histidini]MBT1700452.1 sigma-70 family RNA polymerase sigma factor [Chryseosolibacter histidini]